jgi:predicted methyltransferase
MNDGSADQGAGSSNGGFHGRACRRMLRSHTWETRMRTALIAAAAALVLSGAALAAATTVSIPPYVAKAMADPARADGRGSDARRHGAELVAFSGARPGAKVVDLIPGAGYFTRIFAKTVGPQGRVYALWPSEYDAESHPDSDKLRALAKQPGWRNIVVIANQPAKTFSTPEPVDVVFTSQNYHDYPDPFMGKADPVAFSRQVYRSLKPGGVFLVVDHIAQAGSGMRDTDTLHRIDPQTVKQQVTAAGFVYAGKLDVLRNPADDHRLKVFDAKVRGRTDQFVFKFVKPAKR